MKINLYIIVLFTVLIGNSFAQRNESFDMLHYHLSINVSDTSNKISGVEDIEFLYVKESKELQLNFEEKKDTYGMKVNKVLVNGEEIDFIHAQKILFISTKAMYLNDTNWVQIRYAGVPSTGLIIGENKFKNRTFFGDNWPNRAQCWFACIDHPSDKATVSYQIKAPEHYEVVANGLFHSETKEVKGYTITQYKTKVPIPTKVMVFAAADFKVQQLTNKNNIPLSSWVYPENEKEGFYDLAQANEILDFYIQLFGPYPFEKLANVQSTTQFGGMENASNIFYDENAVRGDRSMETLIAHEIVHQWFGNSASEKEWKDVWLSEGFATYFTNFYVEKTKGFETFKFEMQNDRKQVLNFVAKSKLPVVDTLTKNLMNLLNTNSYQKGSWVLHMLRAQMGDEAFLNGIRWYYETYKLSNANTQDFFNCMQKFTQMDLQGFKKQWLYVGENLKVKWSNHIKAKEVTLHFHQLNQYVFTFPLEVLLTYENGETEVKTIQITEKDSSLVLKAKAKIKNVSLDPNVKLLFEEVK